jgi:hypothetical protein
MATIEQHLDQHEERGFPTLALWVATLLFAAIIASAWSASGTLGDDLDLRPAAAQSSAVTDPEP